MSNLHDEIAAHEQGTAPTPELVRAVSEAVEGDDKAKVRALLADVHGPDLADLIELLGPEQRVSLIETLGADFDYEVLTEVDESVRDQVVEALPNKVLAKGVEELDSDDAAYLLGDLEESDQKEILGSAPAKRTRRAAAQPALSGRDRRSPHAGRLRGGTAVLDGRPGHRLRARDGGPARHLLGDFRRRSWFSPVGQRQYQPPVAHQARGARRRHHGRRPAPGSGHSRPGGGRPPVRALRPDGGPGRRQEQSPRRRRHRRRRGGGHRAGGGRGRQALGRRRRRAS